MGDTLGDEPGERVETTVMPEQRAHKYRLIAGEIRTAARTVTMEESRTSLVNLANAYERMANAADGGAAAATDERSPALRRSPKTPTHR